MIEVKIVIGFGVLNVGISKVYGVLLGDEGILEVKKVYGWNYEEKFFVFEEVIVCFKEIIGECGEKVEIVWNELFVFYKVEYLEFVK